MSNKYVCQTPSEYCTGAYSQVAPALAGTKTHSDNFEAFRCYARFLTKVKGYTQIGGREFAPPGDGPVEVLVKKMRYGTRLRQGKESRHMAARRNSGIIVG